MKFIVIAMMLLTSSFNQISLDANVVKIEQLESAKAIAFSVAPNCNRISGKSYRCCGHLLIYTDGSMSAKLRVSSNRLTGFTGAMSIKFHDNKNRVIWEVVTKKYGVNGYSSTTRNWSEKAGKVPQWVLKSTTKVMTKGVRSSSNRTLHYLYKEGKKAAKDYYAS